MVRSRLRALRTTGLFVANACLSCLALGCSLQLGSWACFQMPPVFLHTITSMASWLYPKPCSSFGSMPKPCSCYLSNHLGEKQLMSVSSCSVSTIGVVVVDVSGDSTAMCSVNFDLRQPRAQLQLGSQVSMFLRENVDLRRQRPNRSTLQCLSLFPQPVRFFSPAVLARSAVVIPPTQLACI